MGGGLFGRFRKDATPPSPPTSGRAPVLMDTGKCVRTRSRFSTCDACARVCPTNAITLEPPSLDMDACVRCGACIAVCPAGAFRGDDGVIELGDCVARSPAASVIELVCPRHPAPEEGPPGADLVIRANGCLAGLGPSAYVWLLAGHADQLRVRLDACQSCRIGSLQTQISRSIAAARSMIGDSGAQPRIAEIQDTLGQERIKRPVADAVRQSPSRRDLFRRIAGSDRAVQEGMVGSTQETGDLPEAALERRRLISALTAYRSVHPDFVVGGDGSLVGLVSLAIDEVCQACGACARVCPTGALALQKTANSFSLSFRADMCSDCGACLTVCEPKAIRRQGTPGASVLLSAAPVVLRQGRLQRCEGCGAFFAATGAGKLCRVCSERKSKPLAALESLFAPKTPDPTRDSKP